MNPPGVWFDSADKSIFKCDEISAVYGTVTKTVTGLWRWEARVDYLMRAIDTTGQRPPLRGYAPDQASGKLIVQALLYLTDTAEEKSINDPPLGWISNK